MERGRGLLTVVGALLALCSWVTGVQGSFDVEEASVAVVSPRAQARRWARKEGPPRNAVIPRPAACCGCSPLSDSMIWVSIDMGACHPHHRGWLGRQSRAQA
jgi:hypothetical protein